MTKAEFEKVNELKIVLENLEKCERYFGEKKEKAEEEKSKTSDKFKIHFPFLFRLKKKSETTADCYIDVMYNFVGSPISVDVEFVDYCRDYFIRKIAETQAEIDSYFEEEKTPEKAEVNEEYVNMIADLVKSRMDEKTNSADLKNL